MNALARQGRTAEGNRVHKASDATCAAGRRKRRIGVPRMPARRRACGGPRQRNTKERANPGGARGALHTEASGRARAIAAQASASRLPCHSIGGRRLVARLCRGTLSRKHIQAASRRRHPRQAHHRKHISKKGSQPWRRRWLSFDSELPSWRSTSRARPQAEASRGLIPWLPCAG